MNRYFFDFDDVPDQCGLLMPSANNACVEAIMSMPEYAAEKLERDGGRAELICSIRENDGSVLNKIVMSMHVEGADGAIILPPFRLDGQASYGTLR